jgi:hypothetical protein
MTVAVNACAKSRVFGPCKKREMAQHARQHMPAAVTAVPVRHVPGHKAVAKGQLTKICTNARMMFAVSSHHTGPDRHAAAAVSMSKISMSISTGHQG